MAALNSSTIFRCGEACLAAAAVAVAFYYFIVPPRSQEHQLHSAIKYVQGHISEGRSEMADLQNLETKAAKARQELALPSDPPMVWVPELLKTHFSHFGLPESNTMLKTTTDEPALPGYQRMEWNVTLPMQNVAKQIGDLLLAVTELKSTQRFVHVTEVAVPKRPDGTEGSIAKITFVTVLRK